MIELKKKKRTVMKVLMKAWLVMVIIIQSRNDYISSNWITLLLPWHMHCVPAEGLFCDQFDHGSNRFVFVNLREKMWSCRERNWQTFFQNTFLCKWCHSWNYPSMLLLSINCCSQLSFNTNCCLLRLPVARFLKFQEFCLYFRTSIYFA